MYSNRAGELEDGGGGRNQRARQRGRLDQRRLGARGEREKNEKRGEERREEERREKEVSLLVECAPERLGVAPRTARWLAQVAAVAVAALGASTVARRSAAPPGSKRRDGQNTHYLII